MQRPRWLTELLRRAGNGSAERALAVGFALAMLMFLATGAICYRELAGFVEGDTLLTHTHEVLEEIQGVLLDITRAESSQRAFSLGGKEEYLTEFHVAIGPLAARMIRLRELVSDNDTQRARVDRLREAYAAKLALMELRIAQRRTLGSAAVSPGYLDGAGPVLMRPIRELTAALRAEESALFARRGDQRTAHLRASAVALVVAGGLLTATLAGLYVLARRELRVRSSLGQGLKRANGELAREVAERRRAQTLLHCQYEVTSLLAQPDPDAVAIGTQVLELVCRASGWELGQAWRRSQTHPVLRPLAAWHDPADRDLAEVVVTSRSLRLARGEALAGRAWAERRPVWLRDLAEDGPAAGAPPPGAIAPADAAGRRAGLRGAVAVPTIFENNVSGVMVLYRRAPLPDEPDERIVALLRAVSYQIGHAAARMRAGSELRAALTEKETLLKETYHRVKNNLHTVVGLLQLQAGKARDESTLALFRESLNRVRSMALVHEGLLRSDDLARVDCGSYFRNLGAVLLRSYGLERTRHVTLECEAAELALDLDHAVPCGLIINEMVSNALKHAFPAGRPGTIQVRLREAEPNGTRRPHLVLTVGDDGVGLPPGLDAAGGDTVGLKLISQLAQQLHGRVRWRRDHGTEMSLTFPAGDDVDLPGLPATHPATAHLATARR